jgi:hypothetical protein
VKGDFDGCRTGSLYEAISLSYGVPLVMRTRFVEGSLVIRPSSQGFATGAAPRHTYDLAYDLAYVFAPLPMQRIPNAYGPQA